MEDSSSKKYTVICDTITQPSNDKRTYKYIKLAKNDLEILLVFNPKEGKSAAAVNVKVGYLEDPQHR